MMCQEIKLDSHVAQKRNKGSMIMGFQGLVGATEVMSSVIPSVDLGDYN